MALADAAKLTPNPGESFLDFYNRYGRADHGATWINANPDSWAAKINDAVYGTKTRALDVYNTWYNEQSAAKKARLDYEYTRLLNQTKYSDEVKALRDAGLNPYAIMAGNGLSAGNMSYSNSEAPQRSNPSQSKEGKKAMGAIMVLIGALIKALI